MDPDPKLEPRNSLITHGQPALTESPPSAPGAPTAEPVASLSKGKKVIQPLTPGLQVEHSNRPPAAPAVNFPPAPGKQAQDTSAAAPPHPNLNGVYPDARRTDFHKEPLPLRISDINGSNDVRYGFAVQAVCVFVLAVISGMLSHIWFKAIIDQLPHSSTYCTPGGYLSVACPGTAAGTIFAIATLFSAAAFAAYLILGKSFKLAFLVAGFLTGLFFFLRLTLALSASSVLMYHWLYQDRLRGDWLIPTAIATLAAIIIFLLMRWLNNRVTRIAEWSVISLYIASILLLPWLVNGVFFHPIKTAIKTEKNQRIELIKNAPLPLYVSKGGSPLTFVSASTNIGDGSRVPVFSFGYTVADAGAPNGRDNVYVEAYEGSADNFTPPTNCGDGTPEINTRSHGHYPCKLFLTTPKGRQVYGFLLDSRTNPILPDFEAINKDQPNTFYAAMGDGVVLSFPDPVNTLNRKSPLTPTVVEQFIDSLEPLTGSERAKFIDTYIR